MNEIITKLNEIEEKADAIISDAISRKEQMSVQLETDKRAVDEKYSRMEEETIGRLKTQLLQEADTQVQKLKNESREAVSRMEAEFAVNRDKMAQEILERLVRP